MKSQSMTSYGGRPKDNSKGLVRVGEPFFCGLFVFRRNSGYCKSER